MANTGVVLLDSATGKKIVHRNCREQRIPEALLEELLSAEQDQVGKLRKRGLFERFDEILDQDYNHEG